MTKLQAFIISIVVGGFVFFNTGWFLILVAGIVLPLLFKFFSPQPGAGLASFVGYVLIVIVCQSAS